MKKFLAILLVAVLALSFAACGGNTDNKKPDTSEPDSQASAGQQDDVQTSADGALDVLNTVWTSYSEDDKFPVAGGDTSEENMSMEGPGKYGIEDTAALDSTLGFPAASVDKIDEAASLVHMMNANTFTCGAFHVKDAADVTAVAEALKENIMQRQWMCGFPDKLVIVKVDDCVVSFFGHTELVDTFKTNLTAAYSSAETICDEPIA